MRELSWRPEARAEFATAVRRYEREAPRAGLVLISEVEVVLEAIQLAPLRFPVQQGARRRAIVRLFPYAIYFDVLGEEIRIVAFHHHRQNPRSWRVREVAAATY